MMLAFGTTANSVGAGTADEAFLKKLAGTWKGRGRLRPNATAKAEPVSCRMSATWSGKSLSVNMNCRGVDVNFSSSGVLQPGKRNNAVQGRWSGAFGLGSANVFGSRNGNALSFSLSTKDRKSGRTVRSSVYMQLAGNGRRLSNSVNSQDGKTGRSFQLLSLAMKK